MSKIKTISFIIPTFKRLNYLLDAISSIEKLKHSDVNVEIIIIDDDPNSIIQKKLNFYHEGIDLKYIRNKQNEGPGYSRHKGFMVSTGNYVVFMDDDDFYTNDNFILMALQQFEKNDNLSMVGFNAATYYENSGKFEKHNELNRRGIISGKEYLYNFEINIKKPKSTFTTVFNKEKLSIAKIEEVNMLNDTIIYLYALLKGDAFLYSQSIGCYRIHDDNITKTLSEQFIVDNVNEKVSLEKKIPFSKRKKKKWVYLQCKDSIIYYLSVNNNREEHNIIDKWVRSQHGQLRWRLLADIQVLETKRRIKGFLKALKK